MSGRLPIWLADWLGVSAAADADGATWQLDSAWSWPAWVTVLFGLAAIIFISYLYARESSGAGRPYRTLLVLLRLVAVTIVLVMLAQWALALRVTGPATIALVVDRSASMGTADRYRDSELPTGIREQLAGSGMSEPTRLNLARLLIEGDDARLLRELSDRYRVATYLVDGVVDRVPGSQQADTLNALRGLSPNGPAAQTTRLGDAVRRVLDDFRGAPPAAIVLLTDGVTTAGIPLADAADDARRRGVPLLAVGLGSAQPPRDIELSDVLVEEVVFVNDPVNLQVQIKAHSLEGEPATLTLRRDGDPSPLVEQTVSLPSDDQTLSTRLMHRPTEPGQFTYIVEVAPRDDETNVENNRERRIVEVRDEKIRVLLVYGYPNYEFRFLKTLLERDSTVELATYLQDADPEYAEQDKSALRVFPVSRDELFEYDALLVGDVDPRLLPRSVWQHMRAFVEEKGGGVAFLAGPRYLPWLYQDNSDVAAMLPIQLAGATVATGNQLPADVARGFTVRPTTLGLQSAAMQLGDTPAETERIWRDLSPLYWLYQVQELKPAAQTLARASARASASALPIICFQYLGAGRVLFHAVDSTWRWRIDAGDTYFARYWVQTVRSLARNKLTGGRGAQLTSDRREYRRGEPIVLRARFLDPRLAPAGNEVVVAVESAGQPRRRMALRRNPAVENVFEATLTDLAEGQYEVLMTEPQLPGNPPVARFAIAAPPGEFARPEMDATALAAAAKKTLGRFYTIADADSLLADLPAGRRVPLENLPPIDIWNRWWMLAAFILAITSEWILRKRKGML